MGEVRHPQELLWESTGEKSLPGEEGSEDPSFANVFKYSRTVE